jgi:hypothetical protein
MVEICIFLEGGIVPHENDSAETVDNSQRFRESFSKLFSSAFQEKVKIIIDPRGGYIKTTKDFSNAENSPLPLLLIDLDTSENNRTSKLDSLCAEFGLSERRQDIYFMVQAMEAWILSQPEILEELFVEFKVRQSLRIQLFLRKMFKQLLILIKYLNRF